jgi:exosortase/archaeosortase family protein
MEQDCGLLAWLAGIARRALLPVVSPKFEADSAARHSLGRSVSRRLCRRASLDVGKIFCRGSRRLVARGLDCRCGLVDLLRWALPAVAFLFFMVPLPFRVETAISVPLQRIAATGSTWLLQLFGLPALREGVRILLGPDELNIAPECSGLRMFIGVLALSYAFAVLSHRPWWDKAALLVASIPVAVIANILRITATGVLYQFSTNPEVRHSLHDNAGLFTILVAAALLASFAWYLKQLVRSVELFDGRDLVQTSS